RLGGCLRMLAAVERDMRRGEPWRSLPPAYDKLERLSRRQIGTAVVLDRCLRRAIPPNEAREITASIVKTASVDFLGRNVPRLSRKKIQSMKPQKRSRYLMKIQRRFFNADADLHINNDESLDLTIYRCRFVELLEKIGERDMALIFCEGDRDFFENHQPEVVLDRPEKLSTGGRTCRFHFRWRNG
ncbi:MAG TPA: L-2-amino-thiazoline-4-carboxylic acid hydrolase, partial [bacterium]|nr:L-2-amino-thiazoline-4-carboxylic acid hydrolase [bacterium]